MVVPTVRFTPCLSSQFTGSRRMNTNTVVQTSVLTTLDRIPERYTATAKSRMMPTQVQTRVNRLRTPSFARSGGLSEDSSSRVGEKNGSLL